MFRGKIPLSACHRPTNILYSHAPYIAPLVVYRLCLYVHALLLLFTGEGYAIMSIIIFIGQRAQRQG